MFQSHVIEANGTFIGAAMLVVGGFRFRAVHPQVDDLDGWTWMSLADLRQATTHLFTTGRLAPPPAAGASPNSYVVGQAPSAATW